MDRIHKGDCVKLKAIIKRDRFDAIVHPVGIVDEIDGYEFWVNVVHQDSPEPVPYVCYENELEKVSEKEYFKYLLSGHNDLPNYKNDKIKP